MLQPTDRLEARAVRKRPESRRAVYKRPVLRSGLANGPCKRVRLLQNGLVLNFGNSLTDDNRTLNFELPIQATREANGPV